MVSCTGSPLGKQAFTLKPVETCLTEIFNVFPTFGTSDDCTDRQEQNIKQRVTDFDRLARIFQSTKVLEKASRLMVVLPKRSIRLQVDLRVKLLQPGHKTFVIFSRP